MRLLPMQRVAEKCEPQSLRWSMGGQWYALQASALPLRPRCCGGAFAKQSIAKVLWNCLYCFCKYWGFVWANRAGKLWGGVHVAGALYHWRCKISWQTSLMSASTLISLGTDPMTLIFIWQKQTPSKSTWTRGAFHHRRVWLQSTGGLCWDMPMKSAGTETPAAIRYPDLEFCMAKLEWTCFV